MPSGRRAAPAELPASAVTDRRFLPGREPAGRNRLLEGKTWTRRQSGIAWRSLLHGAVGEHLLHCKTFAARRQGGAKKRPPAGGSGWPRGGTLTCQSGGSLAGEALSGPAGLPWPRERLGREDGGILLEPSR